MTISQLYTYREHAGEQSRAERESDMAYDNDERILTAQCSPFIKLNSINSDDDKTCSFCHQFG